jgi:FkbM family methyltransferase
MALLPIIKKTIKSIIKLWPPHRHRLSILNLSTRIVGRTTAIDVGASYFPHVHWDVIRRSSTATWVAVDPNSSNLSYLKSWHSSNKSNLVEIPFGLSKKSGLNKLYVTNVDSGSSLLEPIISDDWIHRSTTSYFFPFKTTFVTCLSLDEAIHYIDPNFSDSPIWLKMDTQGSELDILNSLSSRYLLENIVMVESECTLQRIPTMNGSGKLSALLSLLEDSKFEVLIFNVFQSFPKFTFNPLVANKKFALAECDVVFFISPTFAISSRPLAHNLSLISAYLSYNLYFEAFSHIGKVLNHFGDVLDEQTHNVLLLLQSKISSQS